MEAALENENVVEPDHAVVVVIDLRAAWMRRSSLVRLEMLVNGCLRVIGVALVDVFGCERRNERHVGREDQTRNRTPGKTRHGPLIIRGGHRQMHLNFLAAFLKTV